MFCEKRVMKKLAALIQFANSSDIRGDYYLSDRYINRAAFGIVLASSDMDKLISALSARGVNDAVVQYVAQISDPETRQQVAAQAFKNPQIALPEIQSLQIQKKRTKADHIPEELKAEYAMAIANVQQHYEHDPQFVSWFKHALLNHIIAEGAYHEDYEDYLTDADNVHTWIEDMRELKPGFQPKELSFEEALSKAAEWDEKKARHHPDTIVEYEDEGEGVVYSPDEWEGWSIVSVWSENNLLAEGNKMNHCVGDYCDAVETDKAYIFSLRDPSDFPHATIELNHLGDVVQIKGHSNQALKEEYKQLTDSWLQSDSFRKISEQILDNTRELVWDYAWSEWNNDYAMDYEDAASMVGFARLEDGIAATVMDMDLDDMLKASQENPSQFGTIINRTLIEAWAQEHVLEAIKDMGEYKHLGSDLKAYEAYLRDKGIEVNKNQATLDLGLEEDHRSYEEKVKDLATRVFVERDMEKYMDYLDGVKDGWDRIYADLFDEHRGDLFHMFDDQIVDKFIDKMPEDAF